MKRSECARWLQVVCSFLLIILLSLPAFLVAPSSITAAEKTITLKLSSFLPETGTEGQLGRWWGTEVDKRTNGRVKVQYFFAESLVKTMDSLPAVL